MFLLIDPSENDCIKLALFSSAEVIWKEESGAPRDLLLFIDSFLKEQKVSPSALEGIAVTVGNGRFTNTRVATVIGNTFSFVYRIPIIAITKEEIENPFSFISRFLFTSSPQYISATYSGEPNIGQTSTVDKYT